MSYAIFVEVEAKISLIVCARVICAREDRSGGTIKHLEAGGHLRIDAVVVLVDGIGSIVSVCEVELKEEILV